MNADMDRLCRAVDEDVGSHSLSQQGVEALVRAVLQELANGTISEAMLDAAHPHVGGSLIQSGAFSDAFRATVASVVKGD